MRVIGFEKDDRGVSSGGTLFFAQSTGLEIVLDDSNHQVLHQFFPSNRGEGTNNSDFVLLNGVKGSPSHESWEVLHVESRRVSIQSIRDKIDLIEPAFAPLIPPVLSKPQLIDGAFTFEIEGTSGRDVIIQTSRDGLNWENLRTVTIGEAAFMVSENIINESAPVLFRVVVP